MLGILAVEYWLWIGCGILAVLGILVVECWMWKYVGAGVLGGGDLFVWRISEVKEGGVWMAC